MNDDDSTRPAGDADELTAAAADADPAAPAAAAPDDLSDEARDLANYGIEGPLSFAPAHNLFPPTIDVDWARVQAFLKACQTANPRVAYGLGKKIPSDAAAPGSDFTRVDCSGFVRAAIRRSTDPKYTAFPDGSVNQHDWVKAKGFKRGTIADGRLADGRIRIAFLAPQDAPSRIGHVALIRNGRTVESHGGVGPNSRAFNGAGWQARAKVYLLHE